MAYIKATTYVSKWSGLETKPLWHGKLSVRAASYSHRKLVEELTKENTLEPGVYLVTTPLEEADTPRTISHLFRVGDAKEVTAVAPTPPKPNVVHWPPK